MKLAHIMAAAGVGTALSVAGLAGVAHADTTDYAGPTVLGTSLTNPPAPSVAGTTQTRGSTSLPVTGADLEGLAAIGLAALATGLVLKHRTRANTADIA